MTKDNREIKWIKYSDEKPKMGELVGCFRDIESKQIFITEWNKEDEKYADWNEITYWFRLNYPYENKI